MTFYSLQVFKECAAATQDIYILFGLLRVLILEQFLTGFSSIGFKFLHLKSMYCSPIPRGHPQVRSDLITRHSLKTFFC